MPETVRKLLVWILVVLPVLAAATCSSASADEATAKEILTATGVKGGLVVHLGCGGGKLTAALRAGESFLVHGLDARAENITKARMHIRSLGLDGKVSFAQLTSNRLPYVDNLVNLLVVEETGAVERQEIMRVLAPGGVSYVKGGAKWTKSVKPRPAGMDEWTHHKYNAAGIGAGGDTLVGPPRRMQWKAGPEYSRSHENMSSVSSVVSTERRVFAIMDEGPKASIYLPSKWFISARDAFSGVLLWKVPIKQWHAGLFPLKSGPHQLTLRLAAGENRLYATLGINAPVSELDAATGKVLRTFKETVSTEEILVSGDRLIVVANSTSASAPYKGKTPGAGERFARNEKTLNLKADRSVMLVSLSTGKTVWKTKPGPVLSMTTAVEGDKVIFMRTDQLVCVDTANGRELWSKKAMPSPINSRTTVNPAVLIHKGVAYAAAAGGKGTGKAKRRVKLRNWSLTARDAETGKKIWSQPCSGAGYTSPPGVFIIDGLIWDIAVGGEPYRPGTNPDTINRFYVGYDLRTGQERKRIPVSSEHGYGIMHHRCHIPRGSGKNIITSFPGIEFFDVTSGKSTHDSWIRGACLYGFMPANGLLYAPPHPCACYMQGKLSGFWAVAPGRITGRPAPTGRLTKGPAYARAVGKDCDAADWSTYRGDPARRGATKATVPVKVEKLWITDVGPGLSQCVISGGKVVVSTVDTHQVHALDAVTGKKLWEYTAGGRVDSAPTLYRGTVIFGSRDGYVYCLTADKGELVWRFRAARTDRRCVSYDQLESVWPVHGSVLAYDNVAWFCAGRSSYLDGGLLVYRLNPHTGQMLSMTIVDSLGADNKQKPITPSMYARLDMEGAKNDVLSVDSNRVFMRHWAFDTSGRSVERKIDHLFSPTGFLDTSWFRRTYWIYGRKYVGGAQGWARTGNLRPTARIMSLDDDRIYGFGRDKYPPSPGSRHQMYLAGEKEIFFATERKTEPTDMSAKAPARKSLLWSTPGDIQVRGMLLTGRGADKRLFVTGLKGNWVFSRDAYDGKLGGVLRVMSVEGGKVISEQKLNAAAVFDGLSAAQGRLYVSLVNGRILCLGGK
ncbi:MAG: PQQ-binding-like beta-propeller repeat protein [Phycisphaerae bacterium]|jgi:outer membrane protein assembly factor BamB|nr:PQQ-binding-like beta-propeller repeat protein [Phycisphaerae bacterium]